jgi:hypothetical protein
MFFFRTNPVEQVVRVSDRFPSDRDPTKPSFGTLYNPINRDPTKPVFGTLYMSNDFDESGKPIFKDLWIPEGKDPTRPMFGSSYAQNVGEISHERWNTKISQPSWASVETDIDIFRFKIEPKTTFEQPKVKEVFGIKPTLESRIFRAEIEKDSTFSIVSAFPPSSDK